MTHNGCMAGPEDAMAERLARAGVTEREAEVLSVLAGRLRNREIADQLHVSVRTVESHVAALLRKLGVTDRVELAEIGVQVGRPATGAGHEPRTARRAGRGHLPGADPARTHRL
jgi:DNA-binding CsgD family transcriptional regulator